MKSRELKKILNNIDYSISNNDEYIAIGSAYCHDLFSVNKSTLKVKYALDTFNEGRKCLESRSNETLLFIWDKLHELIETGQIQEIINGKDKIENPLPVFTVTGGQLVESKTDAYGWPNTDDNGILMYNNTHFSTPAPAIEYGLREYKAGEKTVLSTIEQLENKLSEFKIRLEMYRTYITHLESLKPNKQ